MPNHVGKTDRDVRRFLRNLGEKTDAANVEKVKRELVRTQQENERREKLAKEIERERGVPDTISGHGDEKRHVGRIVRRELDSRPEPESRRRRE